MPEGRKTTRPDSLSFPDPYQSDAPMPVDTYDRSGQRGGKNCLPKENPPGGTASQLAALGPTFIDEDVSGNWTGGPFTAWEMNGMSGSNLIIQSDSSVFGTGTPGTYNNVTICATNACGQTCTAPFTIVIS